MAITAHELAAELLAMPDIEVGTDEGMIINVTESTYDEEGRHNVPYINLEVSEE